MKTIDEALEISGITKRDYGINLHFNPIPNWYGCVLGFDCPICDNPIDWEWKWDYGIAPQITTDETPEHCKPIVKNAHLIAFGHRWIRLECDKCHTQISAENFD